MLTALSVKYELMTEFNDWMQSEIDKRGWSMNQLARRAKISGAMVSLVMSEKREPGYEFCMAIAKGLAMPPEIVLRKAGLLPAIRDGDEEWLEKIKAHLLRIHPSQRELFVQLVALYARQEKLDPELDPERVEEAR